MGGAGAQLRSLAAIRSVFPGLITEGPEPGKAQVYGPAAERVAGLRGDWAEWKATNHTLGWLWVEWGRLELRRHLIGVFDLSPLTSDLCWGERRRKRELEWRRGALRRLR